MLAFALIMLLIPLFNEITYLLGDVTNYCLLNKIIHIFCQTS